MSPRPDSGARAETVLEVVVPAYNEEGRLPRGLALLCDKLAGMQIPASVVVVDNASTDGTSRIVREWPRGPVEVRLVSCERRGKGAAVRAGLMTTTAPFVGFCDVDMATDLSALDAVLPMLAAGCPAVIGSRADRRSVVEVRHSRFRRVGARVFRAMARVLVGPIGDTQCGFKFFAGPRVREAAADLRETGFAFDVELLARMRAKDLPVVEIPVRWRDVAGSTFSVSRHSLGVFSQLFMIFARVGLAGRGGRSLWRVRPAHPATAHPATARPATGHPATAHSAALQASPQDGSAPVSSSAA
ncbi:Glycosyltransferase involved in cell wall bisynthesis [Sinosporangium album]|uniref:Glycosyltransferase involved in cell wall bisynthesis n=1 Tax=Sinosporangium album TaxID=504805 RepID=A0A1G7VV38_9ACTN|nr:glycosyltransferase [Sinosporangium album]SDG63279.1 Glycosyltransferase involved in cell wall bisynthesis [Sinosporangium album]